MTDARQPNSTVGADRRQFLTAGMAAVVAVSTAPNLALASSADPISAYNAAYEAFNRDLISEEAYYAALERLDDYAPANERDFVRKFIAMWKDGGNPNEDRIDDMLACGVRLMGGA